MLDLALTFQMCFKVIEALRYALETEVQVKGKKQRLNAKIFWQRICRSELDMPSCQYRFTRIHLNEGYCHLMEISDEV